MAIIRPRLIDFYNIPTTQEEVDFAIPFLDEDIPLYLDPFLLWKSPSQQDNALHLILINSFNKLGATYLKNEDKRELIAENLAGLSECSEVGLGSGKTKKGLKISINTAKPPPEDPTPEWSVRHRQLAHVSNGSYNSLCRVHFDVPGLEIFS